MLDLLRYLLIGSLWMIMLCAAFSTIVAEEGRKDGLYRE